MFKRIYNAENQNTLADWKVAKAIPLCKSGSYLTINKYRPI